MRKFKTSIILLLNCICSISAFSQNIWTQKTSLPGPGRFDATAFTIGNNAFICCGDTLNTGNDYLNDFWKYDQVSDVWTQLSNFPGDPRRKPFSFSIDSIGYVGGGYTVQADYQDFWEYSQASNSWTQKGDIPVIIQHGTLGFSVGQYGYAIFIGGGSNLYKYNPQNDTWIFLNSAPFLSRNGAIVFVIGNNAFVGLGAWEKDLWKYDSNTGSWQQLPDFPGLKRQAACAFSIGTNGYVGCGFDTLGFYPNDFHRYDTINNLWSFVGVFPGWPVTQSVGFTLNGKGFLCTGAPPFPPAIPFLWEYSPFVGINESEFINSFHVYPNPFTSSIKINSNITSEHLFRIFDISGILKMESRIYHQSEFIGTIEIKPGIYLYQILDSNGRTVQAGKLTKACL